MFFKTGDVKDLERAMREMIENPLTPEAEFIADGVYAERLNTIYRSLLKGVEL